MHCLVLEKSQKMSNQPTKPKKVEGLTLLDRLRLKHPVELGMEFQGYWRKYQFDGTIDRKILVSSDGDFIGSAKTIKQAIKIIAESERISPDKYDISTIEAVYTAEEEHVETKMREELMPKKLTKSNGIKINGKRFYIVKKKPNGTSSGTIFCLYNFDTRNLIWAHHNRDMLLGFLQTKYKEIEYKDV